MKLVDVLLLLMFIGIILAPAVLLVIGRRKQKRTDFPDFDPGLGGWQARPGWRPQQHETVHRTDSMSVDHRRDGAPRN